MPTTESSQPSPPLRPARGPRSLHLDTGLAKLLVLVNGGVPIAILGYDAYEHQLGVNGVNFAIHTTGLLGLLFLVFSLLVTPIRRLTGWNEVIAVRRTLGLYAFFYLSAHLGIFFLFDRGASLTSTVHEILTRRYLQLGSAGFALLVPLAVTSTDAMVTRLGAKRWKRLHRLVYLATALGVVHYILLVKADLRQPLAFAGALGVLLGYRAVRYGLDARERREQRARAAARRARRFWTGELRVLRVVDETPDVRTFRLGLAGGAPLPFAHRPGQYLNMAITIEGARVNRSYTIASSPTERAYCEVTVKREGRASRYLHTLAEGAVLRVSAPAGRFVFTGAEAPAVLLIAGGVGITPVMAILRYLTERSWTGRVVLVFSVRRRADIVFAEELARLEGRFPNLHVVITLSGDDDAPWSGPRGRITAEILQAAAPDVAQLPVYLCGPDAMMDSTRALLGGLGVPEERIKTEAFVTAAPRALAPSSAEPAISADAPAASNGAATLELRRSMKMTELLPDQSVLEAAEDAGVDIPFECRSGICGQCKTRLVSGRVTMDVQDALTAADRSQGIILACQAHAVTDVAVDA